MKNILLVDDVRLFIEMAKNILNARGDLRIYTAASGLEALKLLKTQRIDLVLCDLYMPDINGDELCRIVRKDEALKNIPFIMVTTSDSVEDIDRCREVGSSDCLSKPLRPTELLTKVSSYIKLHVREHPRITVTIPVESDSGGSETVIGTALDLSIGGFLLETRQAYEIGKSLYFLLGMPEINRKIGALCELVRKTSGKSADLNYYGVSFVNIKEEDGQAIALFVKEHKDEK